MTSKAHLSLVGALGAVAIGSVRHAIGFVARTVQRSADLLPAVSLHRGRWPYDGPAGVLYLEWSPTYVSATATSHLYLLPGVAVATTPNGRARALLRLDREVTDGSLRTVHEAPERADLLGLILGALEVAGAEDPPRCDGANGCDGACVWRCGCRRCRSEPEASGRFHCCAAHVGEASAAHGHVYPSYAVEWSPFGAGAQAATPGIG